MSAPNDRRALEASGTRVVVVRLVLASLLAALVQGAWTSAGSGAFAATHLSQAEMSTPSPVPVPGILPDGTPSGQGVLFATSCASPSWCVAVGYVSGDGAFPLIDTLVGGTWEPLVPSLPQGYDNDGSATTEASLYAVSCAAVGVCSAVGDFEGSNGLQYGLLEDLVNGTWTATQAPTGPGAPGTVVNLLSVSCGSISACLAVGSAASGSTSTPLILEQSQGSWALQSSVPLPGDYAQNALLSSVACADASDCVAVGSYDDAAASSHGLILTLTGSSWTAESAPLPANAETSQPASNLPVLDTVDCADATDCVAGGAYIDTGPTGAAGNTDPLLVTLQSGTWTAIQAPLPSGAPDGQGGTVTEVSCPAVGSCVATGLYGTDATGDVGGMTLSQSGTSWSASNSQLPATPYMDPSEQSTAAQPTSSGSSIDAGASGIQPNVSSGRLVGVSCTTAKFCMAVDGGGDGFLFEDSSSQSSPNWSEFPAVASSFAGISCFSSTFCEAVGGTDAVEWNGASWLPSVIDTTGNNVLAVSCPGTGSNPNYCTAVDSGGYEITYSGTAPSWKTPVLVDAGNRLNAISCSASTFCMGVDAAGNTVKYYSGKWTKLATLSGSPDLLSVSCASSTFCLAGDSSGNTWKWNGSKWSGPFSANGESVEGMSCVSSTFCWAGDGGGHLLSWNNGADDWTSYSTDTSSSVSAVSCAGKGFCSAVDTSGNAMMYASSGWLTTYIDSATPLTAMGCAGPGFCAVADNAGYALTLQNSDLWTWAKSGPLTSSTTIDSISCTGRSFCEAVDSGGNAYTWKGTWQPAVSVTTAALLSVSCPTSTFCDAGDNTGNVWTSTDGGVTWSSASVAATAVNGVSCYSSTFCQAVDDAGDAYTWNGKKWSSATVLGGGTSLTGVSCSTASACQAVNQTGYAFKYSSGWVSTTGTDIDGANDLVGVSCSSSTSCEAIDNVGNVVNYRSKWSSASNVDSYGLTAVSCAALCAISDSHGGVLTLQGPGNWSSPMPT